MKRVVLITGLLLLSINTYSQQPPTDTTIPWWKTTSIYQIYPRSFADSNNDGIGDLRGIISKLDYLKELGVETIWISPFYESPQADWGYDISNYYGVAPEYGTTATVDSLINLAHQKGLKVVFDLVMNHTSEQHPWFKESAASQDNPKADWYIWRQGRGKDGKRPPNNWYNVISQKAWHYSPVRKQWYYTAFLDCQPDLNYRNPAVKTAMFNVVKHWLDSGIDGIRLDIFNCILEDSTFANNPKVLTYLPNAQHLKTKFQNRVNNINHPDNFALARQLRDTIDTYNPTRFMVGEAVGSVHDNMPLVGKNGDGLNMVFLFDMIFYKFKPSFFADEINLYNTICPKPLQPTIVFGNHDNRRSIHRINNSLPKARLLALYQLTTRGVPVIYYGEEIGMRDVWRPKKEAKDPISHMMKAVPQFVRKGLPVPLNRDVCRTPMQWDTTTNAGFSQTTPWLPVDNDVKDRNVLVQQGDTNSLYNTYKELLSLRSALPAFAAGDIKVNAVKPKRKLLSYTRSYNGDTYLVLINFSKRPLKLKADITRAYVTLYTLNATDMLVDGEINISGLGGMVFKVE